ncbi:hypothetical protein [Streptomyces sp. SID10815]|uniref:MarR family transcriptional regulator n=1 Tax=Streptomyces similanensis TaxID=1274988 RepID=A0ABP9KNP4_9ACTN|nr:hypothetical protein [Streptomyces sp. SID10815]NEA45860.1 hypothetical protein [Streptomyces sp. SID10815]
MPVDPEPAGTRPAAEQVAASLMRVWQQAREDVAPTISDEQLRALLALESESDEAGVAVTLDVSPPVAAGLLASLVRRTLVRRLPSGGFSLTGAGRCVLEATRHRRRQLLEQTLVTAAPQDRRVLRDLLDQLHGHVTRLPLVPRMRAPL